MNVKKTLLCVIALAALLICVVMVVLMTSCGPNQPAASPFTLDDAQTLLDAGLFNGDMGRIDDPYIIAMQHHVDEDTIRECISWQAANTSESADEVTVVVFSDEAAAINAEAGFQERIDDQISTAADYAPAAVPRLKAAVIRRIGNTILLAVGDPDRLAEAVDSLH